jgi:hypothetical protein
MNNSDKILELCRTTDAALVQSPGWYRELVEAVNNLLVHDFNRLIQLLYRFDVDEQKIRRSISGNPGTDAAELIAGLLLERQLQKIRLRKSFKAQAADDDEEKW